MYVFILDELCFIRLTNIQKLRVLEGFYGVLLIMGKLTLCLF